MLYRIGMLLGITAGMLVAADRVTVVQLPAEKSSSDRGNDGSAMRPRDLKQLQSKDFQDMLSKAFSEGQPRALKTEGQRASFPEVCSIPLLNAKVEHPERFSMPTIRAQKTPTDRLGGSFSPLVCKQ